MTELTRQDQLAVQPIRNNLGTLDHRLLMGMGTRLLADESQFTHQATHLGTPDHHAPPPPAHHVQKDLAQPQWTPR